MPFCSEKNFNLRVVEKFRAYLLPFWRYLRSKYAKSAENAKKLVNWPSLTKMVFGFSCQARNTCIYMCLLLARSARVRTSDYRVLFFGHTRHLSGPTGEEISLLKILLKTWPFFR